MSLLLDSNWRFVLYGVIMLLYHLLFRAYIKLKTVEHKITDYVRSLAIDDGLEKYGKD